jgi:hypothetical protein
MAGYGIADDFQQFLDLTGADVKAPVKINLPSNKF